MEKRENVPAIDAVIPVYKPGRELRMLLERLARQTVRPERMLLVNTEKEYFDERLIEGIPDVEVIHIEKKEFDHGGTRHMAASLLSGEFLLFMTQDALPADEYLVGKLLEPFSQEQVCASYARQLPADDCNALERYARSFNYGPESRIKTEADLPELGIKTYFCSNVCAMYRKSAYDEQGGFVRHTIFNEDMILVGGLVKGGKAVAYCADARVIHSHNYSSAQQFHRNFDLGVSQAEHPEVFEGLKSEGEGVRMVCRTAGWLCRSGKIRLLPKLVVQSGAKYLGYRMGKNYQRLPGWLVRKCTMNQDYWR